MPHEDHYRRSSLLDGFLPSIAGNAGDRLKTAEKEIGTGLCWRCEHRSIFLETGIHPRFECGMEKTASHSCYMFMPCKPIAVTSIAGERRPIFAGWLLAGRIQSYGLIADERIRLKLIDLSGYAVKGEPLATSQLMVAAIWMVKPKGKKKAE